MNTMMRSKKFNPLIIIIISILFCTLPHCDFLNDIDEEKDEDPVNLRGVWKLTYLSFIFVDNPENGPWWNEEPMTSDDVDWDGGGNETITFIKYFEITETTIKEIYDITATDGSAPALAKYHCESDDAIYTMNGNSSMTLTYSGGSIDHNITLEGNILTSKFVWDTEAWGRLDITEIKERVDESLIENPIEGQYCDVLTDV